MILTFSKALFFFVTIMSKQGVEYNEYVLKSKQIYQKNETYLSPADTRTRPPIDKTQQRVKEAAY